jgi:hypothetical protein
MDEDAKEVEARLLPAKLTSDSMDLNPADIPRGASPSYGFPTVPSDPTASLHPSASLPTPPEHVGDPTFPSAVLPSAPDFPSEESEEASQTLPIVQRRSPSPRSPLPPINVAPPAPMLRSKSQFSPLPVTPQVVGAAARQSFAAMQNQGRAVPGEAYDVQTVAQAQKAAKFAISA